MDTIVQQYLKCELQYYWITLAISLAELQKLYYRLHWYVQYDNIDCSSLRALRGVRYSISVHGAPDAIWTAIYKYVRAFGCEFPVDLDASLVFVWLFDNDPTGRPSKYVALFTRKIYKGIHCMHTRCTEFAVFTIFFEHLSRVSLTSLKVF